MRYSDDRRPKRSEPEKSARFLTRGVNLLLSGRFGRLLMYLMPYSIYLFFTLFLVRGFPSLYIFENGRLIDSRTAIAVYFILSFILFACFERNRFAKRYRWTPAVVSVLIVESFFFMIFLQYHYVIAAFFLLAVVVAWLLSFQWLMSARPFHRRTRGFFRFCRDKASLMCACIAVIILLVPSSIGLYREYLDVYSEKERTQLVEKVSAEDVDEEDVSKDRLTERLSAWDELDINERFSLLCEVGVREEKYLGIADYAQIIMTYEKIDKATIAYYDDEENRISVNIDELNNASAELCVKGVLHEVFHAFQYDLVRSLDFDSETVRNSQYFSTARQWKENMDNYISGYRDFDAYEAQPLEKSARAHADERISAYLRESAG